MPTTSKHLTPERLKIIGETAGAVGAKVADGTIPMKFYEKLLGDNPELLGYFNIQHHLGNKGLMLKLRLNQPTAEVLKQHLHQEAAFGQSLFEPQQTQEEVLANSVLAAVGHLQNLEEIKGPLQRIVYRHCGPGRPRSA